VDKVESSVVCIYVTMLVENPYTGMPATLKISGSGVFVTKKGHVLTCAHLFNLPGKILSISIADYNENVYAGKLIKVSNSVDLAFLQVPYLKKSPYVKLADPRTLKVGQEVVAIGNPLGLPGTVTNGIVSALYRDIEDSYNVTQSNTSINPGNSGGPLFNLKGELIGINSFMISPIPGIPIFTGLGFSVQSGQCLVFLTDCVKLDKSLRGTKWLEKIYDILHLSKQVRGQWTLGALNFGLVQLEK